jgi:uncharacterized protein YbaR (Trm112 family)
MPDEHEPDEHELDEREHDKSADPHAFDPTVLAQLACPACYGDLRLEESRLVCTACGHAYPIVDGIPVLITESTEPGRAERPGNER